MKAMKLSVSTISRLAMLLAAYERLLQTPGGAYAIALEQRSADRSAASRTSP
jgi:hypothetical protein